MRGRACVLRADVVAFRVGILDPWPRRELQSRSSPVRGPIAVNQKQSLSRGRLRVLGTLQG